MIWLRFIYKSLVANLPQKALEGSTSDGCTDSVIRFRATKFCTGRNNVSSVGWAMTVACKDNQHKTRSWSFVKNTRYSRLEYIPCVWFAISGLKRRISWFFAGQDMYLVSGTRWLRYWNFQNAWVGMSSTDSYPCNCWWWTLLWVELSQFLIS